MNKTEKSFRKFKREFSFILNKIEKAVKETNHFDENLSLASFVLAFLQNRCDKKTLKNRLKGNKDFWINLLLEIYRDKKVMTTYKNIVLNPYLNFTNIIKSFDCFNSFRNELIRALKTYDLNVNLSNEAISDFICFGLGYLVYNKVKCQINYELKDVLLDKKYDSKLQIIIYNTRLFSLIKKIILDNCQDKVNDFIVLLIGMSQAHSIE